VKLTPAEALRSCVAPITRSNAMPIVRFGASAFFIGAVVHGSSSSTNH